MIRVTRSENQLGSESDDEPELQVLDSGRHKEALSPHLGKQRKRRLKFFVVFHGYRACRRVPHSVRIKCPRVDSWGTGLFFPLYLAHVNAFFSCFVVGKLALTRLCQTH